MSTGSYLSMTPTGGDELVLIDGVPGATGWVPLAQDWGNAAWEHEYAGARGTQGQAAAQGRLPNRTVKLRFRVYGDDQDDAIARTAQLEAVVDAMRRRGGTITRRVVAQSYRQHMQVLTATGLALGEWTKRDDNLAVRDVECEFTCAPYALGDPMAYEDEADVMPDRYEVAQGDVGNLALGGGVLGITATSTHLLVESMRGYAYGDVQVSARIIPGSLDPGYRRWGVLVRYIDTDNYLAVVVEEDVAGTTSYVQALATIGGVTSSLGATALAENLHDHAEEGGWLVARLEGEKLQFQWVTGTRAPSSPWATAEGTTRTLTGDALASFGPGTEGHVGLFARPQDTAGDGGWMQLQVQPMVLTGPEGDQLRDAEAMRCTIPGTAPALADITVVRPAGNISAPRFAMFGWAARRGGWNRCHMGDFGASLGYGSTTGWSEAARSGVAAAATSITAAGDGKDHATVVLTTTAGSGVHYILADEYRADRTYRATCEVRRVSGTPTVRINLGKSGDTAYGTGALLTDEWQTLEVEWTPTANVYGGTDWPAVVVGSPDTAGGTFDVRRVMVYEAADEPVIDTQLRGRGGRPPLGLVPYGGGGFLVESTSGGTATAVDSGASSLLPAYVDVATSGAGELVCSALIDPLLAGPDDYAGGSIDVDVWIRAAVASTVIGPRVAAWVQAPGATISDDTIGARRPVAPWGIDGKPITGDLYWRLRRIGPVTLGIDPDNPGPWRLVVAFTWQDGSSGDLYLNGMVVTPARARALTPTGLKLSDGGYPAFLGSSGADDGRAVAKRVHADLSASVMMPTGRGTYGDTGLGGSLIELPAGVPSDVFMLTATQVPDDPEAASANVAHGDYLALMVSPTPRWGHLRDPSYLSADGAMMPLLLT